MNGSARGEPQASPQISLTTLAGTPATSVAGGTSRVTTAPAATTESAPMVTPGMMVAAAPIHTFVSATIGADVAPPDAWFNGVAGRHEIDLVGDHHLVCDRDGCMTGERTLIANEDRTTHRDVQPVIGIEGRDEMKRLSDGLAYQLLEGPSDLVVVVRAIFAEPRRESCRDFDSIGHLAPFLRSHFDELFFVHEVPHLEGDLGERWMLGGSSFRAVDGSSSWIAENASARMKDVNEFVRPGDRMFIGCEGGPCLSPLEYLPPQLDRAALVGWTSVQCDDSADTSSA